MRPPALTGARAHRSLRAAAGGDNLPAMARGASPEQKMHELLTGNNRASITMRRVFRRLPSSPNCKLCLVPFAGPGGAVLRHVGFGRFTGNPSLCGWCINSLRKMGVQGAEIPVSLLFADIRGSTAIGERLSTTDYRAFLDRFYRLSSQAVSANDGLVDKFVGDEVIGLFFRGISGDDHAAAAVSAGRQLLSHAGQEDATAEGAIPVGAAVHTGTAFVGSTGTDDVVTDFTALGDPVNTAARLAGQAAAGELVVSVEAARAARVDTSGFEHRILEVRGRSEPVEAVVMGMAAKSKAH